MQQKTSMNRLSLLPRWRFPLQVALLFVGLLLAIWLVTQQAEAPQLILLLLLGVITINFKLPPEHGSVGLTPVVAVSSVLVVGLETAVPLLLLCFVLAELARPLWNPMWDLMNVARPSWQERLSIALIHLLALIAAGQLYQLAGGTAPLDEAGAENLFLLLLPGIAYGLAHILLTILNQLLMRRPLYPFLLNNGLGLVTTALLAQPFAIFGGITFVRSGLPFFVIFSLGVMLFSLLNWLSWQRRFIAEQQLRQFSLLNDVSLALRERLELSVVLARTRQRVVELADIDQFATWLQTPTGEWLAYREESTGLETAVPDDFTCWVMGHKRPLHVHQQNMYHAGRHNLRPPVPLPAAWLGLPLTEGERAIGVMVLQRLPPGQPFSRWSQEMLLALAGQVSAAIHNAQLYSETLRLYNLTDAALAQRVEQLQALLNSVQEGVIMLDPTGQVLLVNPVAAHLLQQPVDHLQGNTLDSPTAVARLGYTPDQWQARITQLQHQHSSLPENDLFTLQSGDDNTLRIFQRRVAPVYAPDRQLIGWLLVLRDVTEEHTLAERRADLTRMIVHDLRNPLTTLTSTLEQLAKRLPAQATTADLLQNAQQTCSDLLDMVDSLMDVNRMEAGQLQPDAEAMHLPPLVERVLHRLQPLAEQRQITLRYAPTADLPPVWGDEELLRRVLLNLLDNALKFTPAGGQISVALQAETAVSAKHEPGIRCTICDSGPGIPAEFRERIFDRFLRTNRGGAQVRGTGLGLTFCKTAVEAHGGRIWAEDAPGGGSCFIVTLPGVPIFEISG